MCNDILVCCAVGITEVHICCLCLQGDHLVMLGIQNSRNRANATKQANKAASWSGTRSRASYYITVILNFSYKKSNFCRYFVHLIRIH